jgi:hypothetical protein
MRHSTTSPAGSYYTITLVGHDGLLGVNTTGNTLDLYRISNGTQLTLVSSTPSQVHGPLSAASGQVGQQTLVFNGINATRGSSEAEAHTVDEQGTLGDVPGSPAVDGNATGGAWVWFDPAHQQVIESEQYSGTLGIYGAQGGALALLSQAPVMGNGPGPMTQLGSVLFVDSSGVNACALQQGAHDLLAGRERPVPRPGDRRALKGITVRPWRSSMRSSTSIRLATLLLITLAGALSGARAAGARQRAAGFVPAPGCGGWHVVPSPNPLPAANNYLFSVAAASARNAWAVGEVANTTGSARSFIEHWDGTRWSVVPDSHPGYLFGVAVVSARDAWAVGQLVTPTGVAQTLIEQWNGTQWQVVPSPNPSLISYLSGVAAAGDVWAVGDYNGPGGYQTLIERWNGRQWQIVPNPNPGSFYSILDAVAAISASDVWAVGGYNASHYLYDTLIEQWNGRQWQVVPSPSPGAYSNGLSGVANVPGTNQFWAIGVYQNTQRGPAQTLIEAFCP